MAEAGIAIAAARLDAVERLAGLIEQMRAARGEGPFPFAVIALEGTLEQALSRRTAAEVEDEFRALLDARPRGATGPAGRALEGPHLSDLIVIHGPNNTPCRRSAPRASRRPF